MTKIKICGITNRIDALGCASLGVDAIGFIFAPGPRQITSKEAKKIIQVLPPYITTVGVFVNETAEKINEIVNFCKLDIVQLHGQEPPEYCKKITGRIVKTFHIKNKESLNPISLYAASAILLDTYSEKKQGGTGENFNWELVSDLHLKYYIILAGGLTPLNVDKAISIVNPYAVDVSSGVEKSPGKKDFNKMKEFVEKVRAQYK
ncbi:MAG: phosphoribosylanthranilate isomerase [Candidatus Firestonebacteria bacterium]|nr:phosphoribosylanthranilate isomerase [Candidatus Firestonebacteria bacterium]